MMVILVPYLGLDVSLIARLRASIDAQVYLHIVPNNLLNIGVAASWNKAPQLYPKEKAWIICNEDVVFDPGALGAYCRKVDELADKESFIMFNEDNGFCCFAWTRVGVERFGLFDENFYPAYEEDWDMKMRWSVAGYNPPNVFGKALPLKHGKPPGGPRYNQMIQDGAALRRDYFIRKWGVLDYKDPVYKTPFNDPSKTIKDWTIEPGLRAELEQTWHDFISQPNPSIYT